MWPLLSVDICVSYICIWYGSSTCIYDGIAQGSPVMKGSFKVFDFFSSSFSRFEIVVLFSLLCISRWVCTSMYIGL